MRETCTTASPSAAADRLPMGGLLALAMTGFIAVLTKNMPPGRRPETSGGLGGSQDPAGKLCASHGQAQLARTCTCRRDGRATLGALSRRAFGHLARDRDAVAVHL